MPEIQIRVDIFTPLIGGDSCTRSLNGSEYYCIIAMVLANALCGTSIFIPWFVIDTNNYYFLLFPPANSSFEV